MSQTPLSQTSTQTPVQFSENSSHKMLQKKIGKQCKNFLVDRLKVLKNKKCNSASTFYQQPNLLLGEQALRKGMNQLRQESQKINKKMRTHFNKDIPSYYKISYEINPDILLEYFEGVDVYPYNFPNILRLKNGNWMKSNGLAVYSASKDSKYKAIFDVTQLEPTSIEAYYGIHKFEELELARAEIKSSEELQKGVHRSEYLSTDVCRLFQACQRFLRGLIFSEHRLYALEVIQIYLADPNKQGIENLSKSLQDVLRLSQYELSKSTSHQASQQNDFLDMDKFSEIHLDSLVEKMDELLKSLDIAFKIQYDSQQEVDCIEYKIRALSYLIGQENRLTGMETFSENCSAQPATIIANQILSNVMKGSETYTKHLYNQSTFLCTRIADQGPAVVVKQLYSKNRSTGAYDLSQLLNSCNFTLKVIIRRVETWQNGYELENMINSFIPTFNNAKNLLQGFKDKNKGNTTQKINFLASNAFCTGINGLISLDKEKVIQKENSFFSGLPNYQRNKGGREMREQLRKDRYIDQQIEGQEEEEEEEEEGQEEEEEKEEEEENSMDIEDYYEYEESSFSNSNQQKTGMEKVNLSVPEKFVAHSRKRNNFQTVSEEEESGSDNF